MISLRQVSHNVERHERQIAVLAEADFDFDRRRMGLLTGAQEQSDAIMDLLAGYRLPEAGMIQRFGRVSWPIGRLLQFRSELSGRDTVRFVCKLYGLDFRKCDQLMHELIDFRQYYDLPIAEWPGLMTVKFGHAAVLLPDFDIYLVDGPLVVGDDAFMALWQPLFDEKLKERQLIMACNQQAYLSRFCRSVAVLKEGNLCYVSSVEAAFQTVTWTDSTVAHAPAWREIPDDKELF